MDGYEKSRAPNTQKGPRYCCENTYSASAIQHSNRTTTNAINRLNEINKCVGVIIYYMAIKNNPRNNRLPMTDFNIVRYSHIGYRQVTTGNEYILRYDIIVWTVMLGSNIAWMEISTCMGQRNNIMIISIIDGYEFKDLCKVYFRRPPWTRRALDNSRAKHLFF